MRFPLGTYSAAVDFQLLKKSFNYIDLIGFGRPTKALKFSPCLWIKFIKTLQTHKMDLHTHTPKILTILQTKGCLIVRFCKILFWWIDNDYRNKHERFCLAGICKILIILGSVKFPELCFKNNKH